MKYSSSFTHDLNFGEIAENWLNILFKDGKLIEVKSDSDEAINNPIHLIWRGE